jgi:hypothetical protein
MEIEAICESDDVFVHDVEKEVGAVQRMSRHRRPEPVIYVENASEFTVQADAVWAVHGQKVILNCAKLDPRFAARRRPCV